MTLATRVARPRWRPGVAAWALWTLTMLAIPVVAWLDHLSRQAGRPELAQLTPSAFVGPVLACVSATTVGAVLASRRPRHPVGWLLLAVGLSVTGSGVADGYACYGLVARRGALPPARSVAIYSPATTLVGLALVGFVLLLTPTGSLPSPRWRWWARVAAAAPVLFVLALTVGPGLVIPPYQSAVDPVAIPALAGAVLGTIVVGFVVIVAGLVVGAGSLVARFRHARGCSASSCAGWRWRPP